MSERIHEVIVVTCNPDGSPHIAPMGIRQRGSQLLIAPFRPSKTLDNLLREGNASINTTDDVRVYAGCLTQHFQWPLVKCERIEGLRLRDALSHEEISVYRIKDDVERPELVCERIHHANHRPFNGYNRAQAAVIELAILVSRFHLLTPEKLENEITYLKIAIDKTAGRKEHEAWDWLMKKVHSYRKRNCA
ncbi:MAG: DUF447 family protein [Sedimenticola sp.]|nr:DUF447 family protein [Sedimenticola sp.]